MSVDDALRALIREELAKLLRVEPEDLDSAEDDELRERVAQRAAAMRKARGKAA